MVSRNTPVLTARALNRATLARQLLLRRTPMPAEHAVAHLVGLQAQNTKPPYYALAARLADFRPEELSTLMEARAVARIVTMRSTIHTHTADDVLALRPLVQPARDREVGLFRKGLVGVDLDRLRTVARDLVEERPRTPKEIREALLEEWPDADPLGLTVAARCLLPLVQVTPRGLWGRSGQVALTTAEAWLGRSAARPAAPDETVLRYLAAFGPASVKDMQTWSGLTRLRDAFERLRPGLLTFQDEYGAELFDLPDAPAVGVREQQVVELRQEARRAAGVQGAHMEGEPGVPHLPRRRVPRRDLAPGGDEGAGDGDTAAVRHAHPRAARRPGGGGAAHDGGGLPGQDVRRAVRDRLTTAGAAARPAAPRPLSPPGRPLVPRVPRSARRAASPGRGRSVCRAR
jgi:hypothetical protein